ncbi:MAG: OmpH family outer membrane protein [Myxococcales bacterium]|nr:MAG: OmpH family outer membrane protein [Myxococcales bacterium]
MIFRRTLIVLNILLGAAFFVSTASAENNKIAVVDLQRAINETEDGRQAKARLKKLFKKRQDSLDSSQKQLKSMKDELEKKKDVLSRDALQVKLEDYQKRFVSLQSKYVDYQKELAAQEGELTKKIVERMERILKNVGKTRGYTMIVERGEGGVVWVPNDLDLTDELISRYNKGEGREASSSKASTSKKK